MGSRILPMRTSRRAGNAGTICVALVSTTLLGLAGCLSGPPVNAVMSYREHAYVNVVPQQFDFSCGASAMATLLNSYFGERFSELELLVLIRSRYELNTWTKRRNEGLTFDDLRYMANELGYSAEGAKIGLKGLTEVNGPVIVHLRGQEFDHFVVLRGFADNAVLVADPTFGQLRMTAKEFGRKYSGFALAVWDPNKVLPESYPLAVMEEEKSPPKPLLRNSLWQRHEPLKMPLG